MTILRRASPYALMGVVVAVGVVSTANIALRNATNSSEGFATPCGYTCEKLDGHIAGDHAVPPSQTLATDQRPTATIKRAHHSRPSAKHVAARKQLAPQSVAPTGESDHAFIKWGFWATVAMLVLTVPVGVLATVELVERHTQRKRTSRPPISMAQQMKRKRRRAKVDSVLRSVGLKWQILYHCTRGLGRGVSTYSQVRALDAKFQITMP